MDEITALAAAMRLLMLLLIVSLFLTDVRKKSVPVGIGIAAGAVWIVSIIVIFIDAVPRYLEWGLITFGFLVLMVGYVIKTFKLFFKR